MSTKIKYTRINCGYHSEEADHCYFLGNKGTCEGCRVYGDCPDCGGTGNSCSETQGIYLGGCKRCGGTGKYLKDMKGKK